MGVPLDWILLQCAPFFPIDYIIMVILSVYVFFATIRGLINIGIRCMCCIHMFDLKPGATEPQGLMIATFLLCHTMLTFSMEMGTLAPQYTAFGGQKYCPWPAAPPAPVANASVNLLLHAPQGHQPSSSSGLFGSTSSIGSTSSSSSDKEG